MRIWMGRYHVPIFRLDRVLIVSFLRVPKCKSLKSENAVLSQRSCKEQELRSICTYVPTYLRTHLPSNSGPFHARDTWININHFPPQHFNGRPLMNDPLKKGRHSSSPP